MLLPSIRPPTLSIRDAAIGAAVCSTIYGWLMYPGWSFGSDFTNHLWLNSRQAAFIVAQNRPTPFVSSDVTGVLYPHYFFYGGTAYVLTAAAGTALSWCIDLAAGVDIAYSGTYLAASFVAYIALVGLSRSIGLRAYWAHVPAVAFTCLPFRVTVAYAGSWGEFVAPTGAIVVMFALVSGVRRGASKSRIFVLAALGEAVLSSAHGISFVWGNTAIALVLFAVVAVEYFGRRGLSSLHRRPGPLIAALGGMAVGAGINLWWIGPAIRYRSELRVAEFLMSPGTVSASLGYSSLWNVLWPWLRDPVPGDMPHLYVQLPSLLLAWAICVFAVAIVLRQLRRPYLVGSAIALASLIIVYLLADGRLWPFVPSVLHIVQYPHRLWTYGGAVAVLIIAAAAAQGQSLRPGISRTVLTCLLGVIVAIGLASGLVQAVTAPDHIGAPRASAAAGVPVHWYDPGIFRQRASVAAVNAVGNMEFVEAPGRDAAVAVGPFHAGDVYTSNLALPSMLWSNDDDLVGFDGRGFAVLSPARDASVIEVHTRLPGIMRAYLVVSFVCATGLVVFIAVSLCLATRRRVAHVL